MNADPHVDADRHTTAQTSYTDSFNAALSQAERDIREGFALYFSGSNRACVPVMRYRDGVSEQAAQQAASDALASHEGEAALHALLQGAMSVEQFREVLVKRHIYAHAEDIAQERAGAATVGVMTMSKPTPGPWIAEEIGMSSAGDDAVPVYDVNAGMYTRVCEYVSEADARLIAAAPLMLHELYAAAAQIEALGGDASTQRAAIAKAAGGAE